MSDPTPQDKECANVVNCVVRVLANPLVCTLSLRGLRIESGRALDTGTARGCNEFALATTSCVALKAPVFPPKYRDTRERGYLREQV